MRTPTTLLIPPPGLAGRVHRRAGASVIELLLMSPLLVMMGLVIFAAAQIVLGRISTDGAAHAAARAASLEHTMGAAQAAAAAAAEASMGDRCGSASVTLTGDLEPGGTVTATLTCIIDVDAPIWPSHEITSTAFSPVDTWRGEV